MNKQKTYKYNLNSILYIPLITIWLRGKIVLLWAMTLNLLMHSKRHMWRNNSNLITNQYKRLKHDIILRHKLRRKDKEE